MGLSCKSYHSHHWYDQLLLCIVEMKKLHSEFKSPSRHNGTEDFIEKWPLGTPVRSVTHNCYINIDVIVCKYNIYSYVLCV